MSKREERGGDKGFRFIYFFFLPVTGNSLCGLAANPREAIRREENAEGGATEGKAEKEEEGEEDGVEVEEAMPIADVASPPPCDASASRALIPL